MVSDEKGADVEQGGAGAEWKKSGRRGEFERAGGVEVLHRGGPDTCKPPCSLRLVYGNSDKRMRPRTNTGQRWMENNIQTARPGRMWVF